MNRQNQESPWFLDVRSYGNVLNHQHLHTEEVTSAQSSVVIDFQEDFDVFTLDFINVIPSANSTQITVQVNNNGSARTGATYHRSLYALRSNAATTELTSATSTSVLIRGNANIASGQSGVSGRLFIYRPRLSSVKTMMRGNFIYLNTGSGTEMVDVAGHYDTAEENDGLTIAFNAANVDSGLFVLQGTKNAANP